MDTHLSRDLLMTAAIFGFFSFVWFGWAQEKPPTRAVIPLAIGSTIGGLIAIAFGVLSWRNWGAPTALDPTGPAWRTYLTVVGVEVALAAAGGLTLAVSRRARFVPIWILFVVGIHFFALAPVLGMPALDVLAALLVLAAAASVVISMRTGLQPSFLTGILAGPILLTFAVSAATLALTGSA